MSNKVQNKNSKQAENTKAIAIIVIAIAGGLAFKFMKSDDNQRYVDPTKPKVHYDLANIEVNLPGASDIIEMNMLSYTKAGHQDAYLSCSSSERGTYKVNHIIDQIKDVLPVYLRIDRSDEFDFMVHIGNRFDAKDRYTHSVASVDSGGQDIVQGARRHSDNKARLRAAMNGLINRMNSICQER